MEKLNVYPVPQGVPVLEDFRVRVRLAGREWEEVGTYLARVDMHNVREASAAYFDFRGKVECQVTSLKAEVMSAQIRPRAAGIAFRLEGNTICFTLEKPVKLSVEINGDRFHNLHLFAGGIPEEWDPAATVVEPGTEAVDLEKVIQGAARIEGRKVVRFAPGLHRLKEDKCNVPSDTTVILSGGAVVMGSFLIYHQKNVSITGRGTIYLGHVKKETYLRGADISYSENVTVEGVIIMNPAHYSVHLGASRDVRIRDIMAFSCMGWCDGIDMMGCSDVAIEDVFLRNSDDCIAIYGARGDYRGDTRNVTVRHAVLWADVAHPTMVGVHGDAENGGSLLEDIRFEDVDILEHHEPQDDYLGCLCINVGDGNTVRNVTYRNIRVEQFERGKLLDIQVKWNKKYNPIPGKCVEHVLLEDISYTGEGEFTSEIRGYDESRKVTDVQFRNLTVRGQHVLKPEDGNIHVGEFTEGVVFQ